MQWKVELTRAAQKQTNKLPGTIRNALLALVAEMESGGPVRGDWPNYSKLPGDRHHCHLRKGRPCYVAVWQVADKQIRLIEVIYAGTHEKAPY